MLPKNEKIFLSAFRNNDVLTTEEVIELSGMNDKTVSVYRDRLIKRGLIRGLEHGVISLVLPRFSNFIDAQER